MSPSGRLATSRTFRGSCALVLYVILIADVLR
jgi:hypothetical protein